MPLTDAERQHRYRKKIDAQGKKRYQLVVPQSTADQVSKLCELKKCTKSKLFTDLVENEYKGCFNQ